MKKAQMYSLLLLSLLIFSMYAGFAHAKTPNYVGIQNNDTYIFDTTYDKSPLKDMIKDAGEANGWSTDVVDALLDEIDIDEDLVGIKIEVLDVEDEETDPWGEDGVRIIYNFYMMEEDEEWDLEKQDETFGIWDYDEDIYGETYNFATDETTFHTDTAHFFDFMWDENDNTYPEEDETWRFLEAENPWFISTKVDWGEVVEELEDAYDDDGYDDIGVRREKDKNKLFVTLDYDEDDELEPVRWAVEYDDDGALMYYEYSYDGDPIVIVERQYKFVYDYFWYIVIGIVALVAVVIIIIKVKSK